MEIIEILTCLEALEEIKQDIELFSMLYITLLGESAVFCRYTALVEYTGVDVNGIALDVG